jgi:hypothetical protein
MKIDLGRTPVGRIYAAAVVFLGLASVGLSVALAVKAAQKPPVLLVPGNDGPRVVEAGLVPDILARDFAQDYLIAFENYAPATIDQTSAFAKSRVAPSMLEEFGKLLENRRRLVLESGMVSQLLLETPGAVEVSRDAGQIEVVVRGTRRVYVADRLAQEARLVYRVALEAGQPTRENPTGLQVLGQAVRIERSEKETSHAAVPSSH